MALPAAWWIGLGAVGMYGYATGRIDLPFFKNKKNSSNSTAQLTPPPQQPQTIIVQPDPSHNRNSYFLPLGVAGFIISGGYYYFIHSNGTKKVIGRVEDTAEETQTLVQKTDDNNSKRFEILDEKNDTRAQTLEMEVRSEQRAGFNVISEQLYCLTQVAIQTLSAVAGGGNKQSNDPNSGEANDQNSEKLLNYCDKAQEMADTILSEEHLVKSKENNLKDIKAEIQLRNQQNPEIVLNNNKHMTPGGPDGGAQRNIFDLNNYNQKPQIMNRIGIQKGGGNEEEKGSVLDRLWSVNVSAVKPIEIGYYAYENRNVIMLSTGMVMALYVGNKTFDYLYYRNSRNTKQLQVVNA